MSVDPIRVLLVEDDPAFARLVARRLNGSAFFPCLTHHAECLEAAVQMVTTEPFDAVLLDLQLPDSEGLETFRTLRAQIPQHAIIILTSVDSEALAVEALQQGAQDYLFKQESGGDLIVRAVRYAVERNRLERERQELVKRLQESLATVQTLHGLLPICASCKQIRDDHGQWHQIENYVRQRTNAEFTHGICPNCLQRDYPDVYERMKAESTLDPRRVKLQP